MNKTILAIGIAILFIGMSFNSISGIQIQNKTTTQSNRGDTLYVGGSGPGNYSTIQDAIDNAINGDTVFVYDDSSPYNEWNIRINKSINLIGEDKNTTVIDGNGNPWVIWLNSSGIISGFSIINGETGITRTTFCWENMIISDNHFVNFSCIIDLSGSRNISIISNSFKDFDVAIMCFGCSNFTISENLLISSMEYWDEFYGDIFCESGNYIITNNTFISTGKYGIGLFLENLENSIIEGNKFNDYKDGAIFFNGDDNYNNTISYNNFTNNFLAINFRGIKGGGHSSLNKIINNNFINNKCDAGFNLKSLNNLWDGNYWDKWIGNKIKLPFFQRFPMITFSFFGFAIDWHPALEPYDI